METALKHGVNYFDEADGYDFEHKNPHSEVRLGMALKGRRNSVHICSKFDERDPEKAKRTLDKILTRLQTDHLDVLMAHDVRADEKDPALMEKGIYAQMLKWKEEGLTRHVGFSSMMTDGKLLRRYIEVLNPEVVLMAINSTKHIANAREALPAAKARNCGVLAMKMLRDIVGKEGSKASELLSHGWQQSGVCSLCVGHSNVAELEDNIRTVQRLALGHPLADHRATEAKMAHLGTPEHLSWARPEYFDRGPRRA